MYSPALSIAENEIQLFSSGQDHLSGATRIKPFLLIAGGTSGRGRLGEIMEVSATIRFPVSNRFHVTAGAGYLHEPGWYHDRSRGFGIDERPGNGSMSVTAGLAYLSGISEAAGFFAGGVGEYYSLFDQHGMMSGGRFGMRLDAGLQTRVSENVWLTGSVFRRFMRIYRHGYRWHSHGYADAGHDIQTDAVDPDMDGDFSGIGLRIGIGFFL